MRCLLPYVAGMTLLVSCTDSSRLPTAQNSEVSPRSGAIIDRSFAIGTVFGGGPPQNLVVSVGNATVCPFSPGSPAPAMIVVTPSGKTPSHAVSREANVQVYQYGSEILTDPCELLEAPLVATGTVSFTHIGNQFAGPGTGSGSFAIQITVHGIVDLVEGGQARLHAGGRFEIRPDGTVVKDQEPVTLKPL